MRKQNSEVKTAFTSEANQKLKNTDSFGFVELDDYACYVIADGIDDDVDAVSAKLAVDTIISTFSEAPSLRKRTLRRCLNAANRALVEAKSKMKLKASVTVVITNYAKLRYGQAGNTRFRLFRDGFLKERSLDCSLSMDLVSQEKLELDKLAEHAERNNLYCFLGQEKNFAPFLSKKFKLSNSDAVALLTRGVWEQVDDGELKDAFADATDEPQPTVDSVEDLLLSGQPDNLEKYTFAAVFFNKIFIDPNRSRKIKKALMIAIPVLLVAVILIVVLLVLHNNRVKNTAAMEQSFYDTIEYIQADNYIRAKEECSKAMDLADKLRDKEMQADTSNYMKLIESVIAGDDLLSDSKYADALKIFQNAGNRSRYADNLGRDYIEDRLERTSQYMSVYELISLGDTLSLNLQYDKAEELFLQAKALSASIYFDRGRDDAITALEKLYTDQKEQQAQQAAELQDTAKSQSAAADILAQGDTAFAKGDYESALVFYTTALQKYSELDDQVQTDTVGLKLSAAENKLATLKAREAEAEGYMSQAAAAYAEKHYVQAKKYYLLAKDVYAGLKNDDKVSEIGRRLELIEMGISEEEQAAKEEAAEVQEDAASSTSASIPAAVG